MSPYIKHNHSKFNQALIKEAEGLKMLSDEIQKHHIQIRVPEVFEVNNRSLSMSRIDSQRPTKELQQRLGQELARLHAIGHPQCGLDSDNFIGLNRQINRWSGNWGEFFYHYRLQYQLSLINDSSVKARFEDTLNQCKDILIEWLNHHCAHFSLLHGDLWAGNVLYDHKDVWMIDPAVYFGDSEADLAMTEMFGGFSPAFYQAYNDVRPLTQVYKTKRAIYNLYHYLNHYNLFGSGYLSACEQGFGVIESL